MRDLYQVQPLRLRLKKTGLRNAWVSSSPTFTPAPQEGGSSKCTGCNKSNFHDSASKKGPTKCIGVIKSNFHACASKRRTYDASATLFSNHTAPVHPLTSKKFPTATSRASSTPPPPNAGNPNVCARQLSNVCVHSSRNWKSRLFTGFRRFGIGSPKAWNSLAKSASVRST